MAKRKMSSFFSRKAKPANEVTDHRPGAGKTGQCQRGDHRLRCAENLQQPSCQSQRTLARTHRSGAVTWPKRPVDLAGVGGPAWLHRRLRKRQAHVRRLRGTQAPEARAIIQTAPGEESQVDQATGKSAILQGYRVFYREAHVLLDELADAVAEGRRKQYVESLATVPLLIIDDFGMRKLPLTAVEDLLEIVMRRYERTSTLLNSNCPVEDWGKLLGDTAAVSSMLDRLLHHGHVLKCGPRSWRTKTMPASAA
jgi:hypothetical protein